MSNKIEYQGVMIRAIAQIIDNAILFTSFGLFHFAVFGTWIRHIPDLNKKQRLGDKIAKTVVLMG